MLGGDGTPEGSDQGEHRVLMAAVRGCRGDDVHVHVAVGDVTEGNNFSSRVHVGDHGRRLGCEPHPLRGGHRDVELDRDAEEPGRLRVTFPVGPEPGAVTDRFGRRKSELLRRRNLDLLAIRRIAAFALPRRLDFELPKPRKRHLRAACCGIHDVLQDVVDDRLGLRFADAMRLSELCDEFGCVHCRGSQRFETGRLWHGPVAMSLSRHWSIHVGTLRRRDSASADPLGLCLAMNGGSARFVGSFERSAPWRRAQ